MVSSSIIDEFGNVEMLSTLKEASLAQMFRNTYNQQLLNKAMTLSRDHENCSIVINEDKILIQLKDQQLEIGYFQK